MLASELNTPCFGSSSQQRNFLATPVFPLQIVDLVFANRFFTDRLIASFKLIYNTSKTLSTPVFRCISNESTSRLAAADSILGRPLRLLATRSTFSFPRETHVATQRLQRFNFFAIHE